MIEDVRSIVICIRKNNFLSKSLLFLQSVYLEITVKKENLLLPFTSSSDIANTCVNKLSGMRPLCYGQDLI